MAYYHPAAAPHRARTYSYSHSYPAQSPPVVYTTSSHSHHSSPRRHTYVQPGAYVAAEMHVALHSASPKLEAFYQYYNDHHAGKEDGGECGSWVDWYGQVVCDVKTLSRLVETEALDAPDAQNTYVPLCPSSLALPQRRSRQDITRLSDPSPIRPRPPRSRDGA